MWGGKNEINPNGLTKLQRKIFIKNNLTAFYPQKEKRWNVDIAVLLFNVYKFHNVKHFAHLTEVLDKITKKQTKEIISNNEHSNFADWGRENKKERESEVCQICKIVQDKEQI